MADPVIITLLGRPVPGSRAQSKFRFLPKRQVDALAQLRLAATEAMDGREMLDGPLRFEMLAEMPIPKTKSKKDKFAAVVGLLLPIVKPDLKNLLWLAEDGLTGVVYADDCLICEHRSRKVYGVQPKLVIMVSKL